MRRLVTASLLAVGLGAGLLSATAAGATAAPVREHLTVVDPAGDAVIHRPDGSTEAGQRSKADVRGVQLVAGRYRTKLVVDLTDVDRSFRQRRFSFRATFTGDNDVTHWSRITFVPRGWYGTGGGDVDQFYDCAPGKPRLDRRSDVLVFSVLNDCVANPDAVRAKIKVRYRFSDAGFVTDDARTPMLGY
jgi:hypothetical protein